MLTDELKARVRRISNAYDLGNVTFLEGGKIRWTARDSVRVRVERHFGHSYEIIENETGDDPTAEHFWVTVRPLES